MAQEQKVNKAKVNKKINFYKFVGKVEGSSGISKKTQVLNIGTTNILNSVNNLGKAVNKLAEMLLDLKTLMVKNFLDQMKSTKKKTISSSPVTKKTGFTGGTTEAIGAVASGLFGGLLGVIGSLFKFFVVTSVLKWLSDPANKDKIENIVKGVGAFLKFLMDITSGVVATTLNAIALLTKLPFWKEILQFGLFMAALGTSFLAFRKIFGGKAAGFVLKGIVSVFGNFFSALTKFSIGLAKRLGPKGLLIAGGAAAAAVGVGLLANEVTGQRAAAPVQATQQSEVNRGEALAVQGTDTMADKTPSVGNLGPASPTGSLPPAASGGPIALPKMPSLSSGGKISSTPKKSDGGLVPPKKRAAGGTTVVPTNNIGKFKPPMMKGPKPSPKGNIKPLSNLSKYLNNGKKGYGKSLSKLMMLPIKVIGLAVAGIVSRLFKMISKIPGAGLLAGMMTSLIVPIAAMFGIPKTVFGRLSSAIGNKPGEDPKQKQKETQKRLEEKTLESQASSEVAALGQEEVAKRGGPKKGGFLSKVGSFFGGLFGANRKKAGGGWISGPQTGYPVSLDGGKSISFIGHGTEYVATKAGGGGVGSAFVIPYDTPSTRGNGNLTGRRISEAKNSGFSLPGFASGGKVNSIYELNKLYEPKSDTKNKPQQQPVIPKGPLAKQPPGDWQKFSSGGRFKNGYLPETELASIPGGGKLHKSVAKQFAAMWEAAKKAGHTYRVNSSYRSFQRQQELYSSLGPGTAARPGTSNHGLGLAVDLWYTDAGYKWLRQNARTFGFSQIPGFATDNPNGHEAWHWENISGKGSIDGGAAPAGPADPNAPPSGPTDVKPATDPKSLIASLTTALQGARASLYDEQPQSSEPATPKKAFGGALGKVELADIVFPNMYLKGGAQHPMQIWAEKFTNLAKKVKPGQSGYDVISQVNTRNAGAEYGKAAFGGKKGEESKKAQTAAASAPKPGDLTPMEQWAKANRKMIETVGTKKQKEILAQLDSKEKALKNATITKADQSAFGTKEAVATADMFKNAKFGTVPFETPGLAPSSSNQSTQAQVKTESEKSQKAEETAKQNAKVNVATNAAKLIQATQNQSNQNAQSQKSRGGAGTSSISIPVPGGNSSMMDDVILYRPGFGLFAGAARGGF